MKCHIQNIGFGNIILFFAYLRCAKYTKFRRMPRFSNRLTFRNFLRLSAWDISVYISFKRWMALRKAMFFFTTVSQWERVHCVVTSPKLKPAFICWRFKETTSPCTVIGLRHLRTDFKRVAATGGFSVEEYLIWEERATVEKILDLLKGLFCG